MKKKLALAVIAALGVTISGASYAGERTGKGGFTPIQNVIALFFGAPRTGPANNSLCGFSGLEDNNGGEVTPGDTQTPHEEGDVFPEPGAARICSFFNKGRIHLFPF